jgi:GT2 family glycosyltransferase
MPAIWSVILSWNGRADTLQCLESLKRQTLPPGKIVVVDNGSTDGLEKALVTAFPEVQYHHLPENLGFGGGMNAGFRMALQAGADYIFALNNDTILAPDCLEKLIAGLELDPRAGAASPWIYFTGPEKKIYFAGGRFTRATLNPVHQPALREEGVREIGFMNGCCPLFAAKALKSAGLYDERFFVYYEDADLSLRIRQAGFTLLLVPQARVEHRHAGATKANDRRDYAGTVSPFTRYIMTRNRLWLLRKHGAWWQKAMGLIFVAATRLILLLLTLLRGRWGKAASLGKGLWEGLFGKIG